VLEIGAFRLEFSPESSFETRLLRQSAWSCMLNGLSSDDLFIFMSSFLPIGWLSGDTLQVLLSKVALPMALARTRFIFFRKFDILVPF